MQYKFVTEDADYSDLASGRVFHSAAGHPAFPIRLASEILQRCQSIRASAGAAAGGVLYDPCCGAGYHLSVLACLHRELLGEVIGSDIDARAVTLAAQNLGLLQPDGLNRRMAQLEALFAQHGKASHQEALVSAARLHKRIDSFTPLPVRTFCASALDGPALLENIQPGSVDIVFTDIPYGQHSQWQAATTAPVAEMLEALYPVLSTISVVAIASDKQQKITHAQYERVQHFHIGKRRIVIFKPLK